MWKITLTDLGVRRHHIGDILRGLVGHKMASRSAKRAYDAYHAIWDFLEGGRGEKGMHMEIKAVPNFRRCIVEIGQCLSLSRSLR